MTQVPDGWTDDMNIVLRPERSLEDVVNLVISAGRSGEDSETTHCRLVGELELSETDAALALDRVHGGVVRAATGNVANRPDRAKDPLAWLSFNLATNDIAAISDLYPHYDLSHLQKVSVLARRP